MFLKETMAGSSGADITSRAADTGQSWTQWPYNGSYRPVVATGAGASRPSVASQVASVISPYTPPSADYTVRFKVKVASFMGAFGVALRASPADMFDHATFYDLQADGSGGTGISWTPGKQVAGAGSSLGSSVPGSYTVGQVLDCSLAISGSSTVTLVLTVDGSAVATWTDSSSPITAAGQVGFFFYHGSTPGDSVGIQAALFESPPEATGFAISGVPGSVNVGSAISGTVTPDGPVGQAETVTIADDLSNTLGTLNFILGDTAGKPFSSAATSGQVGSRTITATPSPTLGTPPTASTSVTNVAATAYTLTDASPASGFVGNASANFTLQANGVPTTSLVVTPSDGSGGTFTPSTVTIADGAAHTFTYTPSTAGSKTIAVTHTGGSGISGDPASVAYTANARTLSASPSALATSSTTTVNFAGGGTHWLTSPPTITASGGVTLGSFTATSDTAGHAAVTTTSAAGSFTYTDSTDSATASGSASTLVAYSSSFDFGAGYAGALASAGYTLISRATQAAIGSRTTAGVAVSGTDGTVSSTSILADPAAPFDVRWDSGGGSPAYGTDPYPLPPYAAIVAANTVQVDGVAVSASDGTLQSYRTSGGFSVVKLAAAASAANGFYVGRLFESVGGAGADQFGYVTGYVGGSTQEATLDRLLVTPLDGTTEYSITAPQAVGSLDPVQVEAGINLRQALSAILAASAGVVSGAGTGAIVIKGGNTSTTRITATTDSAGNRSSVTLTPPA